MGGLIRSWGFDGLSQDRRIGLRNSRLAFAISDLSIAWSGLISLALMR
jgi:hypothetical protein